MVFCYGSPSTLKHHTYYIVLLIQYRYLEHTLYSTNILPLLIIYQKLHPSQMEFFEFTLPPNASIPCASIPSKSQMNKSVNKTLSICIYVRFSNYFFSFIFISWRLITILQWVSSYIDINQLWFYMYSPSRSPLPPPYLPDPSGSSQCTRPEHLSHASNLGW